MSLIDDLVILLGSAERNRMVSQMSTDEWDALRARCLNDLQNISRKSLLEVKAAIAFAQEITSVFMDAEVGEHPMPGNVLASTRSDADGPIKGTVIASVIYREDEGHDPVEWTILLLNDEPPYYTVGTGSWVDGSWVWNDTQDFPNIVPAVNGESLPNAGIYGYVDMGGDY